jgi:hypothetical protein
VREIETHTVSVSVSVSVNHEGKCIRSGLLWNPILQTQITPFAELSVNLRYCSSFGSVFVRKGGWCVGGGVEGGVRLARQEDGFHWLPFQHVDLEAPEVVCGILLSLHLGLSFCG